MAGKILKDRKSVITTAKRIELCGIVQGVGFRPFVYRLAEKHGLHGSVKNASGCLEILAEGTPGALNSFMEELLSEPPAHSKIAGTNISDIPVFPAESFVIENSVPDLQEPRFFTPDLAVCEACLEELHNPNDRRYRHYFNSCTSCGPRFSTLTSFPYDRANTSMSVFPMCTLCDEEYKSPLGRRFHAETIACNDCGPSLLYQDMTELYTGNEAFWMAVDNLRNGGITAIKGIGGYHLACSPFDSVTIKRLRELKGRERKPFAVMFRGLEEIEEICYVSPAERELLFSPAHPIVLLRMKDKPFAPEVLYENNRCGCFLPYTPLHSLLLEEIPRLIMTSANISGAPIIKDEGDIFSVCDSVLYNDREIVRSLDDSVAQIVAGEIQLLRRSRGYVPLALELDNPCGENILALGGDLKAGFSVSDGKVLTMSQYFGDLENADVTERYIHAIDDFLELFNVKPERIVCDLHPRYISSQIGERLARRFGVPLLRVSHHHAHIASVMAEFALSGKVIGVAFDGTGYGSDGNIWGGEFLLCENGGFRRVGHLEYVELLGADDAARDGEKTAACFLYGQGISCECGGGEIIEAALRNHINTFLCSAVGRLFDAVAVLTGICVRNGYEGQCAMNLQYAAERAIDEGIKPAELHFSLMEREGMLIAGYEDIIYRVFKNPEGVSAESLALGFHVALADLVLEICKVLGEREGTKVVALSGGVFQNSLLLSMCLEKLRDCDFSVYYNSAVPPNDGGIALGQSYIAARL